MQAIKTFNRGKLLKLAQAGKLVKVDSYHFDDMMGETRSREEMPVAMKPADWHDQKPGTCYLTEWQFKTKSGCAYLSSPSRPDLVTLIVHSNSNFDFRILA